VPVTDQRRGFLLGMAAYGMWGLFPLYWPLLEPAGAFEILAHRILWSMVTMTVLVVVLGRGRQFRALLASRRTFLLLLVAAYTVSGNWAVFIWAVNHGRVVETSLGYFVNPLVTVLLGVFVLGERLRRGQWVAMGVAGLAVLVLSVDYGRLPWVALALAGTFALYGLTKKTANVGAVESLALETLLAAPLAGAYVAYLVATGSSTFGSHGSGHALLIASSGVVTALPLICFGAAATRVSMVTLGLMQYVAPIAQFALGLLYFHEEMPAGRWAGFALVWVALAVFTYEAAAHRRRQLRLTALASTAA
jgi:chloramphenicol-sensitive protein RarD